MTVGGAMRRVQLTPLEIPVLRLQPIFFGPWSEAAFLVSIAAVGVATILLIVYGSS
jgi:hypothetical protein